MLCRYLGTIFSSKQDAEKRELPMVAMREEPSHVGWAVWPLTSLFLWSETFQVALHDWGTLLTALSFAALGELDFLL